MPDLVLCPLCARHVQITETRCPFCEGELPALVARKLPAGLRRMSRTASLALGASLAVAGCRTSSLTPGSDGGAPDLVVTEGQQRFAGVVQPILAQRCAPCHMGKRFAFASLLRAGADFTASETAQNYQALLDQIDLDAPAQSRLLAKSLGEGDPGGMPHGAGQVLHSGEADWKTLAAWVALERQERCPDCGFSTTGRSYVAYVEQPAISWALARDPIRADHGLRDRARIVLQPLDGAGHPSGTQIDFLDGKMCGAPWNGRCDFGQLAVSHDGGRLAFECRVGAPSDDWVNNVRWNLCVAEIGPGGKAVNPRYLLPAERRQRGSTDTRSDPFGLRDNGWPRKGPYDLHFQVRQRGDAHPAFSADDSRVYYSTRSPEMRSGALATQAYHGFEILNHIVAARADDGGDPRTIYVNDGGEADLPLVLRNGNVAFHTWNLERMDRHLYTQSRADGQNELPALLGRVQGPNMWGKAIQIGNGAIVGITGRRRSSVANYVTFFADHTLGVGLDAAQRGLRILDDQVFNQIIDYPTGYCSAPPDGPSCFVSRFYAEPDYWPDGRAVLSHNPEKTYVLQGEALFLAYSSGNTVDERVASMQPYVPRKMGVWLSDWRGQLEKLVDPPAGKMLRWPVWVGRRAPPRVQPWVTDEGQKSAELHIADVPLWMSFARPNGTTNRASLLQTLDRVVAVRVLVKELDGNACTNDGRPYRYAVNAAAYDHPTHLGINNATGYRRLVAAAGGDAFGDVPLQADRSLRLRLPAGKLLLFQGIDAAGFAVVQRSRLLSLAPGQAVEAASVRRDQYGSQCASCHGVVDGSAFVGLAGTDKIPLVPLDYDTAAARAAPVDLSSVASRPQTFLHVIRPLLDGKCVTCHAGATPAGELSLEKTYSAKGNFPAGKWATVAQLADPAYLASVPPNNRVPAYNYSVTWAWNFREDQTVYKQDPNYAPLISSYAPLGPLAPWDPAYQNLFAHDANRWVYLGGFFNPNFGRSDRLGGLAADSWLVEILSGKDLDPTRAFTGPDHTKYLTSGELRDLVAVIDIGFPYMERCDDRTIPTGPNANQPWGEPTLK
ncbi:MAG: hypothetical protein EXR72_22945 [Myxococcales bacterium]|nr:hypothetical protein [Myxococcales bacterium]